jgi:hypothetical protein
MKLKRMGIHLIFSEISKKGAFATNFSRLTTIISLSKMSQYIPGHVLLN